MTELYKFALVKITEGQYKGRMGRLYDDPYPQHAELVLRVVLDERLKSLPPRDVYNIFPSRVVEFVDMSQPSDEFMDFHAQQLKKILVDEMNKSIKTELILERISTLGELYDLVVLRGLGWQTTFWEKFTGLLGPPRKKRPKKVLTLPIRHIHTPITIRSSTPRHRKSLQRFK